MWGLKPTVRVLGALLLIASMTMFAFGPGARAQDAGTPVDQSNASVAVTDSGNASGAANDPTLGNASAPGGDLGTGNVAPPTGDPGAGNGSSTDNGAGTDNGAPAGNGSSTDNGTGASAGTDNGTGTGAPAGSGTSNSSGTGAGMGNDSAAGNETGSGAANGAATGNVSVPVDGGATGNGSVVVSGATDASGTPTDGKGGTADANATASNGSTGHKDANGGNGANSGNSTGGNASSTGNGAPVAKITIPVRFYNCTTDPGSQDPSRDTADCSAAAGVSISVTIDGTDGGTFTSDPSGAASFDVPQGSAVVVTEDQFTIAAGYVPYGNGEASVTAADGVGLTFVHLPSTATGRAQVTSGTCPTSGAPGTVFRVIEPGLMRAASVTCGFTGGVDFTISGGALASSIAITTDDGGNWRGFLVQGDYTITSQDGKSSAFTVSADGAVAIVAINYIAPQAGTLSIARWQCSPDKNAPTTITMADTAPKNPRGCTASDGKVLVTEVGSSASPAEITLGAGGVASINLKPGSYLLTDESSAETVPFDLNAGATLHATIAGGPPAGSVDVSGNGSDGNASGNGESGNASGTADSGTGDGSGAAGNASGGDNGAGAASGDGTGVSAGDSAAAGVGAVTALPNTGTFKPRRDGDSPLFGAVVTLLGLVLAAGWAQHRRSFLGR